MLKVARFESMELSKKCFADCRCGTTRASTVQMGLDRSPRYQRISETPSSKVGGVMLHGRAIGLPISAL